MVEQHTRHGRAIALFAGLATAFFVFAMQLQSSAEALSQATAKLTESTDRSETWRKENVTPDGPIRRAERGLTGETALKAKLREVTRRQDRIAQQRKAAAAAQSSSKAAQ